jgi:hypothetical protein
MRSHSAAAVLFLITLSSINLGMARNAQYDEEARAAERLEKQARQEEAGERKNPAKKFVEGVKQVTVDSTTGFISDTAEETRNAPPVVGTIEGAAKGSETVLDNTVKGASKVATLGFGEIKEYDVVEPEDNSGEPTKIRIKIPGT